MVVGRLQRRSWTAEDGSARLRSWPTNWAKPALGDGDDNQGLRQGRMSGARLTLAYRQRVAVRLSP